MLPWQPDDVICVPQVAKGLSREFGSLLHFVKEDLARQEYVMNIANEELQAALNVVLEENMYLGQVLFYCLDRLFLQVSSGTSTPVVLYRKVLGLAAYCS